MIVIFVHGWSVRNVDTYGDLPARLREGAAARGIELKMGSVFLGQYVSFQDDVTVDDIARAFQQALTETVLNRLAPGERIACITHSTGGPVVRKWLDLFYGPDGLHDCPMSHLVMLAPANHGSALAQLGKSRLARLKFLLEKAQPGQHVLNWLELGSAGQWELNLRALDYDYTGNGVYPFVLTGQRIDRTMYDHLNSYTGEAGSDGVVRACAANMNFNYICLEQQADQLMLRRSARTPKTAFGILPGRSHSGDRMGIIRSVKLTDDNPAEPHPTVEWVLRCLAVDSPAAYQQICGDLDALTAKTQNEERSERIDKLIGSTEYITDRYCMFTVKLRDDRGESLTDYDLMLTAGPNDDPNELPDGFFIDRQRNQLDPGRLTYYLNHDRMSDGMNVPVMKGKLGFQIIARPDQGLARYRVASLHSDVASVAHLLQQNETVMVEITLRRDVNLAVFRLTDRLEPAAISDEPLEDWLPLGGDPDLQRKQRFTDLADALAAAKTDEERQRIRDHMTRFLFGP